MKLSTQEDKNIGTWLLICIITVISTIIFFVFKIILTWFFVVNSTEGNYTSHMKPIKYGYYFQMPSYDIWYDIGNKNYGQILKERADSIGVSSSLIYGYSNYKYFIIDSKTQRVYFYTNRDSLAISGIDKIKFYTPENISEIQEIRKSK